MGSLFEKVNKLSVLSVGRRLKFSAQDEVKSGALPGPPSSAADGTNLEDAVIAMLAVRLREDAASRTADVTIDTVDDTATYTVTIDSNAVNYAASGGDTETEIVEGLRDAINADGTVSAIVTATVDGDTLKLSGDGADDYTIAVSATGSGALSFLADATEVDFKIWLYSSDAESWFAPEGGEFETIGENWIDRADVAGVDRAYVEITATDGRVTPHVAPGGME